MMVRPSVSVDVGCGLSVMALGVFHALQFQTCNVFGTRIFYPSKFLSMHTTNIRLKSMKIEARNNTRTESPKIRNRRMRKKFNGTPTKPRLSVFCSDKQLYAMLVDDHNKKNLFYGSTLQKTVREDPACSTVEAAKRIGEELVKEYRDMVKQGPCCHCGVTSTPLWRNGPAEKPVLCNACGSRWRTKGSLTNYTPLHSRAEPDEIMDYRVQRMRAISLKHKEAKVLKRKQNHDVEVAARVAPDHNFPKGARNALDYNHGYFKTLAEDISNRSSSGSAISNSESCVHLGSAGASDLTGAAQSIVWDSMVPSRKRTCVGRAKPSSIEKLTKDLYAILQEQQTYFSGSTEDDLLLECDTPVVSVEIGHGSVLIRHPSSIAHDEESEASSLSVSNKPYYANEACSQFSTLCNHTLNKFDNFSSAEIEEKKQPVQEKEQELYKRKDQREKLQILENHKSPICSIELKDVLNFEEFERHITSYELQELMKLLPSVDTVGLPNSLRNMFDSPQFKECMSAFQKLLADGVFDLSSSEVNSECNRTLKRLLLCNLTKSFWVEQYNILEDTKCKSSSGSLVARGNAAVASAQSLEIKRSCDGQLQNLAVSGSKKAVKTNYDNEATCFGPKILLEAPRYSTSLMLDCLQFADESSDHDLLLNIPSQSSFRQAELFLPNSGFGAQASTSSSSLYQNHVL